MNASGRSKHSAFVLYTLLAAMVLVLCQCGKDDPVQVPAPQIVLSKAALDFNATQGAGDPPSQSVTISNGGSGDLTGLHASVTYISGQAWLSASVSNTVAPATLTLRVINGALPSLGTYNARVLISSNVATNSPRVVGVTCTVWAAGGPGIGLSRTSVSFNATEGGGSPPSQTVSVTNTGSGTLTGLSTRVSYQGQSGWLTATLNRDIAPAGITVRATTGSLSAGTYTATISVSSTVASNSPQQIAVTFTVGQGSGPAIALSPTSVTFNTASLQTVSVTNSGTGTLTGLSASVTYQGGQTTGWLSASLNTTTAPATLTLQSGAGLSAGTYNATVAVSSPVASNSPQNVSVVFNVAAAQTGALRVIASTSGSSIDPNGYVVTVTEPGQPDRTANIGVSGSWVFPDLSIGSHTVTLSDVSATCSVPSNPRTVTVVGNTTVETVFNVTCQTPAPTRQITLVNSMSTGLSIHEIVQVKVAATTADVYTRSDLLTDDPAECLSLPGESIPAGGSQTFDITIGDNYAVFLGIGIWDLNNFSCTLGHNWFKRRFFTDLSFQTWYVWTVAQVSMHAGGDWTWTISGSYLNSTLTVTPANNPPIPFFVTDANPIP